MSLQVLAQNMASRGRNGDDMLVHMSREEVADLQRLAKSRGLTLTINPETGLPEAFSLKSLIKTVAPIALGAVLGPAGFGMSAFNSALAVGGIGALATGSLQKGLMMGLGAYGGAGLAGSISNMGTGALSSAAGAEALAGSGAGGTGNIGLSGLDAAQNLYGSVPTAASTAATPNVLTSEAGNFFGAGPSATGIAPVATVTPAPSIALTPEAANIGDVYAQEQTAQNAVAKKLADTSSVDRFRAGLTEFGKAPSRLLTKENLGYGVAALAPMLGATPSSAQGVDPNASTRIRDYTFDPISGTYTYVGARKPSEVVEQGMIRRAGGGVLVGYADGGPTEEQLKSVSQLYSDIGRTGDTEGINYWAGRLAGGESLADLGGAFGASAKYVQQQEMPTASPAGTTVPVGPGTMPVADSAAAMPMTAGAAPSAAQLSTITDIYRNTLGRDPDVEGLNYWAGRLAQGESLADVYSTLQGSARSVLGSGAASMAPRLGSTLAQATTPYTGYTSPDTTSIGDEWVRNVLGREATAADRALPWYQGLEDLSGAGGATRAYDKFLQTYGLKSSEAPSWFKASQLTAPKTVVPVTTAATTGMRPGYTIDPNATVGSGLVRPEETAGRTTGFTPGSGTIPTMQDVVNTYTQGGGMTGRLPYVPRSVEEQEQLYNRMTGDTRRAYEFLQGRGEYPIAPINPQIMRTYGESVLGMPASTYNQRYIFDAATQRYMPNPNYKAPIDPAAEAKAKAGPFGPAVQDMFQAAQGGIASGMSNLGDYSDGGRLLKGPGDGVSDSIPATIGDKRPARLADGEFVVPARVVSELGNGSTDAGARKLYAMMDRIQNNRRKSVGKDRVAVNSKSDKYLPA